jgi:predicted AlkP superfamily pyrophosphatase or phosphodiesterase
MKQNLVLFSIILLFHSLMSNDQILVLISMDGFRHDYINKYGGINNFLKKSG